MMFKKLQKCNKGLSLIELIVVIAIMMIIVTVVSFGFSLITGREAHQCANNISTALDKAKNYCMTKSGKSDAYLELSYDPNRGYIAKYYAPSNPMKTDVDLIEEETVGRKAVKVTFDGTTVDESHSLKISYDRVNGAFKLGCGEIKVTRGRTYVLKLTAITGKHTLERS